MRKSIPKPRRKKTPKHVLAPPDLEQWKAAASVERRKWLGQAVDGLRR